MASTEAIRAQRAADAHLTADDLSGRHDIPQPTRPAADRAAVGRIVAHHTDARPFG